MLAGSSGRFVARFKSLPLCLSANHFLDKVGRLSPNLGITQMPTVGF